MISLKQYFTNPNTGEEKPHTAEQEVAVADLLQRREALRAEYYAATGKSPNIDPDTGTEISGKRNGSGDGGFRLPDATTGKGHSSHQVRWVQNPDGSWYEDQDAKAGVDDSDQHDNFDNWLNQFEDGAGGNSKLEEHGLYREHPDATPTWCHLTTRAPHSGRRTFQP